MLINCICTIRIVLYIETYGDLIHSISLITGIRMGWGKGTDQTEKGYRLSGGVASSRCIKIGKTITFGMGASSPTFVI